MDQPFVMKVSKSSNAKSVGGALANELGKSSLVEVRAIGVQAVNQTVKAIAIAGGFIGQRGRSITCRIGFHDVKIDELAEGKEITAISFQCTLT